MKNIIYLLEQFSHEASLYLYTVTPMDTASKLNAMFVQSSTPSQSGHATRTGQNTKLRGENVLYSRFSLHLMNAIHLCRRSITPLNTLPVRNVC